MRDAAGQVVDVEHLAVVLVTGKPWQQAGGTDDIAGLGGETQRCGTVGAIMLGQAF